MQFTHCTWLCFNTTPLINAIKSGRIESVKLLVSNDSSINNVDKLTTPFYLACKNKNFEIVEYLLANGADVNSLNCLGKTSLHYAIENNCSNLVTFLLNHNADVNAKDFDDETPIYHPILYHKVDIVKMLINLGADVNNVDKGLNRTPLCLACKGENFEIITCLLESGADPNGVDKNGFSPLMHILSHGWSFNDKTVLLVELLLDYGADVNVLCPYGENVLSSVLSIDLYYKNCSNIILQHVAKLQEINIPIDSKIIDTILNHDDFNNYFAKCKLELTTAKNTKLRKCWVTLLNILIDDEKKLVKYAGNSDLINDFRKTDFTKKFPIYGDTIQKRMTEGIRVRKLWNSVSISLCKVLKILNPTHLIIRDILDTLNKKDLLKLQ